MPTAAEEAANPEAADDAYIGATKRLRELTRGDKNLLLKENIAYGFHRNMLAMRPTGVTVCVAGILYGLLIAKALRLKPLGFDVDGLTDPGLAAGLSLLVSAALLAAWLLYFSKDSVRRMGFVYAERLFERLPSLPGGGRRSAKTPPTP
jgi:hypothetical protein